MISNIWKTPLIKIDKDDQFANPENEELPLPEYEFEQVNMGDSWNDGYDNMLFSGSHFTGDKLINKENEVLDKYKWEFKSHDHNDEWQTEHKKTDVSVCGGDAWEHIWGCCEFETDAIVRDKKGDVIDRFHCIHFHQKEKDKFRHFIKARKLIEECSSYQVVVKQLKKIQELHKHFFKS